MKKYPELKCSICSYIPDEDDLKYTDYKLDKCNTCSRENVCDLCLSVNPKDFKNVDNYKTHCPMCADYERELIGKYRKFWLNEEYPK